MNYNTDNFIMQYPGVYEGAAKAAMDEYFEMVKTINESGPVDVDALIKGEFSGPQLGAVLEVTEDMALYCNNKYDPDNPLLHDAEYAKKLGFDNLLTMTTFSSNDDVYTVPTPPAARDTLLVSQINHNIKSLRPVYPGDTVYMVKTHIDIVDLTPPEGSIYRSLLQKNYGTIYNQNGEIVSEVCFSLMESVKLYKEGKMPKPKEEMGFMDMWEAPNWMERPLHKYTDKDWETIKNIWKNEKRRGAEPLYWEDVKIGDRGTDTAYGPILEGNLPAEPYGMGVGGSRSLKYEILDPEIFKTLIRDGKTGNYSSPDREVNVPTPPKGMEASWSEEPEDEEAKGEINTADIHETKEERAPLLNFLGRDIALKHVQDWMGDHGWIFNLNWCIMPPDTHAKKGKPVPENPDYIMHIKKVPGMENATIEAHGLTNDLVWVKSCVTRKYVQNQEYFAELTFWIETILGEIWLSGAAIIKLPSKTTK